MILSQEDKATQRDWETTKTPIPVLRMMVLEQAYEEGKI